MAKAPRAHVQVHIDELVLHGFPPGDHHRLARAVQRELGRLLDREGIPPAWLAGGAVPHVHAGDFALALDARPAAVGAQVARVIYGGVSK